MAILSSQDITAPVTPEGQLGILCIGAHPDDCDLRLAGMALKYRALGHRVKFVSMTNGDGGHHEMGGGPLARRRNDEAQAAAAIADIEYELLDIHDGELLADLYTRNLIIRMMRDYKPDLVICHRPNDYHPDHRAVGITVQDAAYLVTVPNVCALTPILHEAPVIGYMYDDFTLPNPYVATVAVDTDDVFEPKIDMSVCHASQWFEWLPFNSGELDAVPATAEARREWLGARMRQRFCSVTANVREALVRRYGEQRAASIQTCEAFMLSEYGRPLADEDIPILFPFLR
jgi:LmbE family N-acetylglucosaminyl deacetylase